MSDYRLIALDVDGTLLTPEGALTPRMVRAARLASERGITVALATARRWTGAAPVAGELGAVGRLILYDGAVRRGYPGGGVEDFEPLSVGIAREAAGRIAAAGVRVVAQYSLPSGERMVATSETPSGDWMESYLAMFHQQLRFRPLDSLLAVYRRPLRLVSFGPLETLRMLAERLSALPVGCQILPVGSYGVAELTIFSPGASKGAALVRLATDSGVSMAETLAIGDGVNDISMLRAAGLGVAMGHAAPQVRAAADVVTASNRDDGAARAIERYVLGETVSDTQESEPADSPVDEERPA